jgi:hypothetical protein
MRTTRDQLDHGRERELARRLFAAQMLSDVAPDFWQRGDELRQPVRLAMLADLLPVGMITILQPARGIDPHRLQMRGRVHRIAHLAIGRRHRHRMQAPDHPGVANMCAIGANEGIAFAALDAADGQFVLVAELQPELPGQRFDRRGRRGPGVGLGKDLGVDPDPGLRGRRRPLPERLRQGDIGIGFAAPCAIVIQLIHHESKTGFTHLLFVSTRLFYGSGRETTGLGRRFRGSGPQRRVPRTENGFILPPNPILGLMPRNGITFRSPFGGGGEELTRSEIASTPKKIRITAELPPPCGGWGPRLRLRDIEEAHRRGDALIASL